MNIYVALFFNVFEFFSPILAHIKKKILVLRPCRALKIPPDETFLSWEGKKIAAARQNVIFYK